MAGVKFEGKVVQVGNSNAVVLPKPIQWKRGTAVELIIMSDKEIVIKRK